MNLLIGLFCVLLFLIIVFLILYRVRDQMFLKKKTKEVISDRVKNDIMRDKENFVQRQARFERFMSNKKNVK